MATETGVTGAAVLGHLNSIALAASGRFFAPLLLPACRFPFISRAKLSPLAVAADASVPSVIQFSDLAIERPWFLRDTAALGLPWTIEPGAWNCLSRRSQIVLVQESRGIKIILAQWPWPHGVQLIRFR
jgi:hypothetical protein